MKNFLLTFNEYDFYIKPTQKYLSLFKYTPFVMKGKFEPNTYYEKGSIVFDNTTNQKFYILVASGTSSSINPDTIIDLSREDTLQWVEYYDMLTYTGQRFSDILKKYPVYEDDLTSMVQVVEVDDNIRLDNLSYINYNTTDYADLLFVINNMQLENELPSSVDVIQNEIYVHLHEYADLFGYPDYYFEYLEIYLDEGKWGYYDNNGNFVEITNENELYYLNKFYNAYIRIMNDLMEKNEKYRNFMILNPVYFSTIKESFNKYDKTDISNYYINTYTEESIL